MSKINTRATINANIKQNGNQEITGQVLNSVLNTMVDDYAEQEKLTELESEVRDISNAVIDIKTESIATDGFVGYMAFDNTKFYAAPANYRVAYFTSPCDGTLHFAFDNGSNFSGGVGGIAKISSVEDIAAGVAIGELLSPPALDGKRDESVSINKGDIIALGLHVNILNSYTLELTSVVAKYGEDVDNLNFEVFGNKDAELKQTIEIAESGKYVNTNGGISSAESFIYSKPIEVIGGVKYVFKAAGYENNVAMISETDAQGSVIIPKVRSRGSSIQEYEYTPSLDGYIIVSCYASQYELNRIGKEGLAERVEGLESAPNIVGCGYMALFKNAVCIGDSLTRGYQAEYPIGQRNRDGGYPTRLSRLTRLNVYNYGHSGATPTSWMAQAGNKDFTNFDVALICLGRNGGLSSADDVANYKAIIDKLISDNSNMTIFCLSLPPSDGNAETDKGINEIIKSIASEKSAHYIDIYNDVKMASSIYRNDGVHYYPLGYYMMAEEILVRINEYIDKNKGQFMQIYTTQTYDDIYDGLVE